MAPIDQKQQAEARMLRLIDDSGLPAPDEVVYGEREISLMWHDQKVVVVVELEGFAEAAANGQFTREGIAA